MNIPPWAKQAHEDWQRAIESTKRIQQKYNEWLSKLDHFRFSDSPPQNIREELSELLSLQIQYFQQITPWIDAKIQELRSEEHHNVTYHVGDLITKLNELQMQMASLERQLRIGTQPLREEAVTATPQYSAQSEKDFRYSTFEQIFRQPSAALKESLRRYIAIFTSGPEPVVDLGCGRGEFLELMRQAGKEAYGVDFNSHEVQRLNETGLKAVASDFQQHLQQLESESIGGVFSAQVVEHMHPDAVYDVLSELHRVMKPGAPLVMETLNPLSVFSYHHLFFKDPTHVFAVHPDTLMFMMRYTGFRDAELHLITPVPEQQKLPEPKKEDFEPPAYEYLKLITTRLNQFLYDSLEYYVIARKI